MTHTEFEWHGGNPVTNFINTLDERLSGAPVERLDTFDSLVSFAVQASLLDKPLANQIVKRNSAGMKALTLDRAKGFREALWRVLSARESRSAVLASSLSDIESVIHDAIASRRLTTKNGVVTWIWKEPAAADRLLFEIALAANELFENKVHATIKRCAAEDCGVLFLDSSQSQRRKWCDMTTCGNRNKVRRFRSEHRS